MVLAENKIIECLNIYKFEVINYFLTHEMQV